MIEQAIPLLYLAAAASFILALKWLSAVPTARRGVIVGIAGMALAVGGTLLRPEIVSYLRAVDVKEIHGYDERYGLRRFTPQALERAGAPHTDFETTEER